MISHAGENAKAAARWAEEGRRLFAGDRNPSRGEIVDAAIRVWLGAMLDRHRSMTRVAAVCKTSRKSLRDALKRLELYGQWLESVEADADHPSHSRGFHNAVGSYGRSCATTCKADGGVS